MEKVRLQKIILMTVPMYFLSFFGVRGCPKNCICSDVYLKCNDVGLKTIDFNIPPSIRHIDLSNNQSIKLEKHAFSKFKHLQYLLLNNCSINDPLYLPASIEVIDLSSNKLSASSLKTMLREGNMSRLKELYLATNGIQMDKTVFSMLPRKLQILFLKRNIIPKICRNYFAGFKDLTRLIADECNIQGIESGAFDSLKKLKLLRLNDNSIQKLPKGLFRFNAYLIELHLRNNLLEEVPDLLGIRRLSVIILDKNRIAEVTSSHFPMDFVGSLELSNNRITSFNLSNTKIRRLDLSINEITRIEASAISSNKMITQLFLHNNKISYIAPKAFNGMVGIAELFLQRNQLETLPKNIFKGIGVDNLVMFGNRLRSIEGLLDGMKRPPRMLLLFGNSNLTRIRGKDLHPMTTGSVVYIGCTKLKSISMDIGLRAKVICSPSNELELHLSSNVLNANGFSCEYTDYFFTYVCKPCTIGQQGSDGRCISCPAGGFYQDETAALSCKECPLGQYVPLEKAPGKGPLECLTCPKGTNTKSFARYRACPCLEGYTRKYRFGECKKCIQEGFECERDYQELMRGYWMSWSSMRTASNQSCKSSYISFMQNIDTKNDTYDRQTVRYECRMPKPHKCPIKGSCLGGINASCSAGYTGVLCAVCDNGFMKNFNKCTKCPSPVIAVVQCVAYVLAFLFVCWLITLTEKIKLAKDNDTTERNNPRDERTFADVILSSLKILIGFYQVLIGIFHALDYIQWPTALKTTVNFFEYIQLAIIRIPSLHCIRPDWRLNAIGEFYFALIATTSVLFVIFLYFAVKSVFLYYVSYDTNDFRKRQKTCLIHCLRAACLLLFAVYPIVSSHIVKILPQSCHRFCTAEIKGKCLHEVSFLRSDYSVKCLTSSMSNTLIMAYVALILPIGFPFALLLLLWRNARHSGTQSSMDELITPINDDQSYLDDSLYFNARFFVSNQDEEKGALNFALKFAYENYVASCWYWEVLETLRKLIMIVGIALFLQHTKVGLGSMIIIAIIFTTLHAIKSPIKDKFENFLQLLSLSIIPINLAVGAILHSKSVGDESIIGERDDSWALGILLIVLNSLLIIFVIIRLLRLIIKRYSSSNAA